MVFSLGCFFFSAALPGCLWAASPGTPVTVGVVVSRHIKPYMQAEAGLRAFLEEQGPCEVSTFILGDSGASDLAELAENLQAGGFKALVSIGPEATDFIWSVSEFRGVRVFTMVLSPGKVLGQPLESVSGVTLTIPIDIQLGSIQESIPSISTLGLLFNPRTNHEYFQRAQSASQGSNIEVVPLKVNSRQDVPGVLESSWGAIDGLWLIPDRTVISKSLVEYIIKEALYQKIPVIGYNRFFYQAGAAMAFVFDYGDIGQQTGRVALAKLGGQEVSVQGAVFEVWKKDTVLERIGLQPAQ